MKKAVLITIGDEILSGNTIDTNSNFIATQLKNIGFKVVQIFTISDEIETIKKNLKSAFELGNLVITTGGLGPTKDDKTKKAFAEFSVRRRLVSRGSRSPSFRAGRAVFRRYYSFSRNYLSFFFMLSMNSAIRADQNLKASPAEPHLVNRSSNSALR